MGIHGEKSIKDKAARENWSHQLAQKQVPKKGGGAEPGVPKGKRSLLACHTRCIAPRVMKFEEVWLVGKSLELVKGQNDIRERETSTCWIISPYRPYNFQNVDFKRSTMYPCLSSFLESRLVLRINRSYVEQVRAYRINWGIKRQRLVDMGELYYSSSTHMWNLVKYKRTDALSLWHQQ